MEPHAVPRKHELFVRCIGLHVIGKTFQKPGLLNSFLRASSGYGSTIKTEKRTVRISQSSPFKPPGRPPSLLYETVYISETIDDIVDINPSLVAEVSCPQDWDVKVQVNVYYSSTATSLKEILLCGGTFNLRDLLRNPSSAICVDLMSEHTQGAKAFIEIMPPLSPVLADPMFGLTALKSAMNPLFQRYVFYNEDDSTSPFVDAEEFTWEPRLAMKVSLLFLESVHFSLLVSCQAWVERKLLEEMRQGIFSSTKAALSSGWHKLIVSVKCGRIDCKDNSQLNCTTVNPTTALEIAQQLQQQALLLQQQQQSGGGGGGGGGSSKNQNNMVFVSYYPIFRAGDCSSESSVDASNQRKPRQPSVQSLPPQPPPSSTASSVPSTSSTSGSSASAGGAGAGVSVASGAVQATTESFKTKKRVKIDESKPSTFVKIFYEHKDLAFSSFVGRTNTEFATYHPVYGSNINSEAARKIALCEPIAGDNVHMTKNSRDFHFQLFESVDRTAAPVLPHPSQSIKSSHQHPHNNYHAASSSSLYPSSSSSSAAASASTRERYHSDDVHAYSSGSSLRGDDADGLLAQGGGSSASSSVDDALLSFRPLHMSAAMFQEPDESHVRVVENYCLSSYVKVEGQAASFHQYIPSCDARLRFEIYREDISSGKSSKIGIGYLPLSDISSTQSSWLLLTPVRDGSFLAFEHIELLVSIKIVRSQTDTLGRSVASQNFTCKAPVAMPYSHLIKRDGNGTRVKPSASPSSADYEGEPTTFIGSDSCPVSLSEVNALRGALSSGEASGRIAELPLPPISEKPQHSEVQQSYLPHCSESIAKSYEWLWSLGFSGIDPLSEGAQASFVSSYLHPDGWAPKTTPTPSRPASTNVLHAITLTADNKVLDVISPSDPQDSLSHHSSTESACTETESATPPLVPSEATCSPSSTDSPSQSNPVDQFLNFTMRRLDFPYPVTWLDSHLAAMHELCQEVGLSLSQADDWHHGVIGGPPGGGVRYYRPSALKKEAAVQPLPTNLHIQLLAVRRHGQDGPPTDVVDSITSGCYSPHGLGHKKGGLDVQEEEVGRRKQKLSQMVDKCKSMMRSAGDFNMNIGGPEYDALQEVGKQVLAYEQLLIQIGKRRIFAVSQAVSTATIAVMTKLNLVMEGHIPETVAEKWLSLGFLLVFEGLLSVSGNEKSMLEDTTSAVDALRHYQVRLVFSPDEEDVPSSPAPHSRRASRATSMDFAAGQPPGSSPSASLDSSNRSLSERDSALSVNTADALRQSHYVKSRSAYELDRGMVDVTFSGREVQIHIPGPLVQRLPALYRSQIMEGGGAVIKLIPTLFTQGIDMQQTLVTSFSMESSEVSNLQFRTNIRGLQEMNDYCYRVQPINDFASSPCPLSSPSSSTQLRTESTPAAAAASGAAGGGIPGPGGLYRVNVPVHPLLHSLNESIRKSDVAAKNVDMLLEVERACLLLNGCRVTFCKSGKDRTGMAVTLDQSRQLGERFALGPSTERLLRDANLFRLHGTRIGVCEKNIGKRVYSINKLQVQFLPVLYRPPHQVCEQMMKKDNS